MKIDTTPTKITAKKVEYSIFSGVKYCFVNVDPLKDWSWDGQTPITDFQDKGESVLFSAKELEAFCPSKSVHGFLLELNESRKEEIERLKKEMKKAKTFWVHSRFKSTLDFLKKHPNGIASHDPSWIMKNWTCNPKQIIKDRIEFLENNVIRFVEIHFQ